MKKLFKFIIFSFLLILLFPLSSCNTTTSNPLDEISNYNITVNPRNDGTLDIETSITWKVLDSDSEGPLTWVKIGIPNYHVDNIKALSDTISKIDYYEDDGAFIRIDFNKSYYKGDTVTFNYSFHQSYMYYLEDNKVIYSYTPGWFDKIKVKSLMLKWNKNGVEEINDSWFASDSTYYIYSKSLDFGEKFTLDVTYDRNHFTTINEKATYTNKSKSTLQALMPLLVFVIIFAFIIIVITIANSKADKYRQYRGFRGQRLYYFNHSYIFFYRGFNKDGTPYVNSSSGHVSSGGFSCACACACAGGGRAGCSRKYYYNKDGD